MSRFFSTPKRTAVSTACIAAIIFAVTALINTASSRDHHVGEINAGAEALKNDYIGAGHAKAIALEHANLSENDVRFLRAELDRDDGIMIYEVSFRLGRTEYEYAIDAVTGDIIGYDIDRD